MSNEADALRGKRAEEILNNEVYSQSYAMLETEVIGKWRESRNADDREQLHQFLMMLGKVQNALETVMRTGQVAQAEITRKATRADQMTRFVRDRAA